MKTRFLSILGLFILLSCGDDSSELAVKATKEIYYRTDTGEKQAEKILTYDSRGNLVNERYYDLKFSQAGYEIQNVYNDQNQKTKLTYIFSDINSVNSVTYSYKNGKLTTETFFQGDDKVQRSDYFYSSQSKPDSLREYSIYKSNDIYSVTKVFTYDNQTRLIEERWKGVYMDNLIVKMITYSNGLLIETCNPLSHMPEGKNCTKYEYNPFGKVSRIYSTLTGEDDVLLEEYDYEGTVLKSKKVFNQQDAFPPYNADQTIYTILIKYEYAGE